MYDISFFSYIRSGDILSFKLPEKRDTTDVLSGKLCLATLQEELDMLCRPIYVSINVVGFTPRLPVPVALGAGLIYTLSHTASLVWATLEISRSSSQLQS